MSQLEPGVSSRERSMRMSEETNALFKAGKVLGQETKGEVERSKRKEGAKSRYDNDGGVES